MLCSTAKKVFPASKDNRVNGFRRASVKKITPVGKIRRLARLMQIHKEKPTGNRRAASDGSGNP